MIDLVVNLLYHCINFNIYNFVFMTRSSPNLFSKMYFTLIIFVYINACVEKIHKALVYISACVEKIHKALVHILS